jgi:hypothetical protein
LYNSKLLVNKYLLVISVFSVLIHGILTNQTELIGSGIILLINCKLLTKRNLKISPGVEEEDDREKDKDMEEKRKQLELLEEEKAKEDAQVALEEYMTKAADGLEGGFISRSPQSREKMEREKKEKEEREARGEGDGAVRLGADDGIINLRKNEKKNIRWQFQHDGSNGSPKSEKLKTLEQLRIELGQPPPIEMGATDSQLKEHLAKKIVAQKTKTNSYTGRYDRQKDPNSCDAEMVVKMVRSKRSK